MPVTETAPAKLNLALHVTGRRVDGYHLLDSLVAFAGVGDVVMLEPGPLSLQIEGPFADGLSGQDNLCLRAARLVGAKAAIRLAKNLPVASGIGGGSADAAATLRALARLGGIALADPRLHAIAATLGADVPPCLIGRTALGTGRGDDLATLTGLAGTPLLLVALVSALLLFVVFP